MHKVAIHCVEDPGMSGLEQVEDEGSSPSQPSFYNPPSTGVFTPPWSACSGFLLPSWGTFSQGGENERYYIRDDFRDNLLPDHILGDMFRQVSSKYINIYKEEL